MSMYSGCSLVIISVVKTKVTVFHQNILYSDCSTVLAMHVISNIVSIILSVI